MANPLIVRHANSNSASATNNSGGGNALIARHANSSSNATATQSSIYTNQLSNSINNPTTTATSHYTPITYKADNSLHAKAQNFISRLKSLNNKSPNDKTTSEAGKKANEEYSKQRGKLNDSYLAAAYDTTDGMSTASALSKQKKQTAEAGQAARAQKATDQLTYYSNLATNDDFTEKSKVGHENYNKNANVARGKDPGNKIRYADDHKNDDAFRTAAKGSGVLAEYNYLSYADENERAVYDYILGTQGNKAGDEFLEYLKPALMARAGIEQAESIAADTGAKRYVREATQALGAGIDAGFGNLVQNLTEEARPLSAREYGNMMTQEDIAKRHEGNETFNLERASLDAINTIGSMTPMLVAGALGGVAAGAIAGGLTSRGGTYRQLLDEGYSVEQADEVSTVVGLAESLTQYALGGISAAGGKLTGAAKNAIAGKADAVMAKLAKPIAKAVKGLAFLATDVAGEVNEEIIQNKIEAIARNVALYEDNPLALNGDDLYTAIVTAISTSIIQMPAAFIKANVDTNISGDAKAAAASKLIPVAENIVNDEKARTEFTQTYGEIQGETVEEQVKFVADKLQEAANEQRATEPTVQPTTETVNNAPQETLGVEGENIPPATENAVRGQNEGLNSTADANSQQNTEEAPTISDETTARQAYEQMPDRNPAQRESGQSANVRSDNAMSPELRADYEANPDKYNVKTNKETLGKALDIMEQGRDVALKHVEDAIEAFNGKQRTLPGEETVVLTKILANELTKAGEVEYARKLTSDMGAILTAAGQFGQANRILRNADPVTVKQTCDKLMDKINKYFEKTYGKKYKEKKYVAELTPEEIKRINNTDFMADSKAFETLINDIKERVGKEAPSSFRRQAQEFLRVGMLSRPATHIGNFVANMPTMLMHAANDIFSAGMQSLGVKATKLINEEIPKQNKNGQWVSVIEGKAIYADTEAGCKAMAKALKYGQTRKAFFSSESADVARTIWDNGGLESGTAEQTTAKPATTNTANAEAETAPIKNGTVVKALDRNNFGYVEGYSDGTYTVRFTNKDGATAHVKLSADQVEATTAKTVKQAQRQSKRDNPLMRGGSKWTDTNGNEIIDQDIFRFAPLEDARRFIYKAMEIEDYPFVKRAFVRSLAQYCEIHGITDATKVPQSAIDAAVQDAYYYTYKNENAIADVVSGLKKIPVIGDMVNIKIPFTTTVANIGQMAVEHQPVVALIKAAYQMSMGESKQTVIDTASKGLTGAAVIALGAALKDAGLLSSDDDDDKDKNKFLKAIGQRPNALKGKYDISQLQPFVTLLTFGAALSDKANSEDAENEDWLSLAFSAACDSAGSIMDMEMVKSIAELFDPDKYGNDKGLKKLVTSTIEDIPGQVIPGIWQAVVNSFVDPVDRYYFTDGGEGVVKDTWDNFWTAMSYYSGFGRKKLPEKVNVKGTSSKGNKAVNAIDEVFYPGKIGQGEANDVDNYLLDLEKESKDKKIYPDTFSPGATYTNDNGDEIKVGVNETGQFQKTYSEAYYRVMDYMIDDDFFKGLSKKEQASVVNSIKAYAKELAIAGAFESKGIDYTSNLLESVDMLGSEENISEYYAARQLLLDGNVSFNENKQTDYDALDKAVTIYNASSNKVRSELSDNYGNIAKMAEAKEKVGMDAKTWAACRTIKNNIDEDNKDISYTRKQEIFNAAIDNSEDLTPAQKQFAKEQFKFTTILFADTTTYEKVVAAGVSPDDAYNFRGSVDDDNNGSIKQAEAFNHIADYADDLDMAQKLWKILCPNTKKTYEEYAKKNGGLPDKFKSDSSKKDNPLIVRHSK